MNKPFLIVLAVLAFFMIVIGYQCGESKEAKRTAKIFEDQAKKVEKEADEHIDKLLKENEQLEEENEKKDKIIVEKEAENEQLIEQKRENEKRMADLRERIQIASPESLVETTREILDTKEVWWSSEEGLAKFSLSAFRSNALKLSDWQNFTLVREPGYKQQVMNDAVIKGAQAEKIIGLGSEIGNLKIVIIKEQEKYTALSGAFKELKRYSRKKGNLFTTVLSFLAGVGLGKIL